MAIQSDLRQYRIEKIHTQTPTYIQRELRKGYYGTYQTQGKLEKGAEMEKTHIWKQRLQACRRKFGACKGKNR